MNSLQWFQVVLSLAVQATLVTAIACATERRCESAGVKARIWTCYYLAILAILTAGLLLPRAHWTNPWQHVTDRNLMKVVTVEQFTARLFLIIWVIGIIYLAIRWIVAFFVLHRFLRSCPPLGVDEQLVLNEAAPATLLELEGRAIEFRICPEYLGPFCYQFHRPVVFLPQSLVQCSTSELKHVLQHELTHLRTRHPLQVFMQRLVQTIFWFLPAIWWAGRRARLAREYVCDEAAVDYGASTASYLRTLLTYAQKHQGENNAVLAIAPSSSELRLRAQRLANLRSTDQGLFGSWAPSMVLLLSIIASQIWLPTNPLASPKTSYSPWPAWSAAALHTFDISVKDFDRFDARLQMHDLLEQEKSQE